MSIAVNQTIPVIAAQGAAPDLALQPGSVIDAQVLKVLSNDLVRIAISNLAIDVLTEVPLSAGQNLQLAVSQTPDGIRLAIVGQGPGAANATAATTSPGTTPNTATAAPGVAVGTAIPPVSAAPTNLQLTVQLTPPERLAVAVAAQNAASQQGSLAPLFANLGVVVTSNDLPPQLQQAVLQLLAQQTNLDQNLTGNDVKDAFRKSGIFLETSLASGSVSPGAGVPDLKAALIVLRQALLSSLPAAANSTAPATGTQQPVSPQPVAPQPPLSQQPPISPPTPSADDAASSPHGAAAPTPIPIPAPPLVPEIVVQEILLPRARLPVAEDPLETNRSTARIVLSPALLNAAPRAATAGAVLNLLQEVVQGIPRDVGKASVPAPALQGSRPDDVTVHTNTPPPPFRGALPFPQPVASPSIAPDAPLATNVRHLLDDTGAALARQTLLQVASLPQTVDTTKGRPDPTAPHWSFEIPFVTPQGTAVTQFEISRDGSGSETEAAKRIWRARFSLNVEPAGPVHALVSLSGERTSVRMWAERPATVAQLRAGAAQLTQALSEAALVPGDIVIRDGAPPQSAPARAGHFLDRAL